MVTVRSDLDQIPEYQPGRQASPAELEAAGIAQLSSNEAPWAPSADIRAQVAGALDIINRYPSMSSADLRARLAEKYQVDIANVVVGAGGVEIGRQAAGAVIQPGDEVVYADPSFPEYEILTRVNGGVPVTVPLRNETHDVDAMAAAVTERTRMLIVCNPNNPTGTGVPIEDIVRLLQKVSPEVLVLVDEAYFEFAGEDLGASAVSLVDRHDNLVVLRTFSKAFGLAAVRVGYGITSRRLAGAMRKVQLPFSVNGFAEAAALGALDSEEQILAGINDLRSERERMRDALASFGFPSPKSYGNFLYFPFENGQRLLKGCEDAGIAVRTLGPGGSRITIGSKEDNDRVLEVARALGA